MEQIAAALGDGARWRIVELLAERPRSVGELAELTGLRQPQTTKHLQTLVRAGLATVTPLGQRRVYALEPAPLRDFAARLGALAGSATAHAGERDVIARYRAALDADGAVADRPHWADDRTFTFARLLPAAPAQVWQHWVDPELLASWWAPSPLTVTACVLEPRPGGRAEVALRDAEGSYHSTGRVHAATEPEHLAFDLAVHDATGAVAFTGHYDLTLTAAPGGTRLRLNLRLTDTTVGALAAIAGIEPGWHQVLDNLTRTLAPGKEKP